MRILRFDPAAVGAWIGTDAIDLVDGVRVALGDLDKAWRPIAGAETESELLEALTRFKPRERDDVATESVRSLRFSPALSYPQLAGEMGYSYEQWRRRVRAATGVSPKFLDRYFRLQRATVLARQKPSMSMREIAFQTGFDSDCRLAAESTSIAGRTFRNLASEFTLPE